MKYYSEEDMKDLRRVFEKEVLSWPEVSTKRMFGCPCYQADKKPFAFLVTDGLVITQLSDHDREALAGKHETGPFRAGKRTIKAWPRISVRSNTELAELVPYVRKSYENALKA